MRAISPPKRFWKFPRRFHRNFKTLWLDRRKKHAISAVSIWRRNFRRGLENRYFKETRYVNRTLWQTRRAAAAVRRNLSKHRRKSTSLQFFHSFTNRPRCLLAPDMRPRIHYSDEYIMYREIACGVLTNILFTARRGYFLIEAPERHTRDRTKKKKKKRKKRSVSTLAGTG